MKCIFNKKVSCFLHTHFEIHILLYFWFSEEKRNRSQKFAADVGLPVLSNVLLPKTRGFCLCLETLRNTLDAGFLRCSFSCSYSF